MEWSLGRRIREVVQGKEYEQCWWQEELLGEGSTLSLFWEGEEEQEDLGGGYLRATHIHCGNQLRDYQIYKYY
jgi:hypothetical protein